jgi:hypothetical protein
VVPEGGCRVLVMELGSPMMGTAREPIENPPTRHAPRIARMGIADIVVDLDARMFGPGVTGSRLLPPVSSPIGT